MWRVRRGCGRRGAKRSWETRLGGAGATRYDFHAVGAAQVGLGALRGLTLFAQLTDLRTQGSPTHHRPWPERDTNGHGAL